MPCATRLAIAASTAGGARKSVSATHSGITPAGKRSQRVLQVPRRSTGWSKSKAKAGRRLLLRLQVALLEGIALLVVLVLLLFLLHRLRRILLELVHAVVHVLGLDRLLLRVEVRREPGGDGGYEQHGQDGGHLQDHELEHALVDRA